MAKKRRKKMRNKHEKETIKWRKKDGKKTENWR